MRRYLLLILIMATGCKPSEEKNEVEKEPSVSVNAYDNPSFSGYWDQGKAELTSYDLEQSRYGETHKGEAVLIFVTEDFSKSKQVKLDNPQEAKEDAAHILKLNFTKKFITGIYPYSMMMSAFTPLNGDGSPLKITATSQEWCGHTFTQLNKSGGVYNAKLYSYFESEGDQRFDIAAGIFTEDGIWSLIRINPEKLPKGEVTMLPSTLYQRLSHTKLTPQKAICGLQQAKEGIYQEHSDTDVMEYSINYPEQNRILKIHFLSSFPFEIIGWEDTHAGINGEMGVTRAVRRKVLMLDYWKHNSVADTPYRDSLNVKY